jgi:hypothetical protein
MTIRTNGVFLNLNNRIIFAQGTRCVFLESVRKFSYRIQTIIIPPTVKFQVDHFLAKPHFSAILMAAYSAIKWLRVAVTIRQTDTRQESRHLFPYTEGPGWLWNPPCARSKETRV